MVGRQLEVSILWIAKDSCHFEMQKQVENFH